MQMPMGATSVESENVLLYDTGEHPAKLAGCGKPIGKRLRRPNKSANHLSTRVIPTCVLGDAWARQSEILEMLHEVGTIRARDTINTKSMGATQQMAKRTDLMSVFAFAKHLPQTVAPTSCHITTSHPCNPHDWRKQCWGNGRIPTSRASKTAGARRGAPPNVDSGDFGKIKCHQVHQLTSNAII